MKILLIGSDGFLEKNIIEKFGKKHSIDLYEGGSLSSEAFEKAMKGKGYECVIDCGGDTERLVRFKELSYACAQSKAKLLEIAVHYPEIGAAATSEKEFENVLPKPRHTAEYVISRISDSDESVTLLRLFSPYGRYCDVGKSKLMELMARAVTGKKTAVIERDFEFSAVSVDDVLKVIAAYLYGKLESGTYNVACDKTLTLSSVAKTAKRLAAKDYRDVEISVLKEGGVGAIVSAERLSKALPTLKYAAHSAALKSLYEHLLSHKSQARPQKEKES